MDVAARFAQLSSAVRLQVGAIVVKDDRIIIIGYNGMPSGWDNVCEDTVYQQDGTSALKTKPEVLHAESNAIAKLAKSNDSGLGAEGSMDSLRSYTRTKALHMLGVTPKEV